MDEERPGSARSHASSGPTKGNARARRQSKLIGNMAPIVTYTNNQPAGVFDIPSPVSNDYQDEPLMLTDLDFFEQELMRYQESLKTAVVDKRAQQGLMLDDPDEELAEVYGEVQTMEADFKKAVDICKHLLGHSRELFERNQQIISDLDNLRHEHDLVVN